MMKKLNWYYIKGFEGNETIKIKEEDMQEVKYCIDNDIEMKYDTETYRVYNEANTYIADIESIEEGS